MSLKPNMDKYDRRLFLLIMGQAFFGSIAFYLRDYLPSIVIAIDMVLWQVVSAALAFVLKPTIDYEETVVPPSVPVDDGDVFGNPLH